MAPAGRQGYPKGILLLKIYVGWRVIFGLLTTILVHLLLFYHWLVVISETRCYQ